MPRQGRGQRATWSLFLRLLLGAGSGYKAEDFGDLVAQLKPMGLSVVKMDADGNCLFRSVADQLWGEAAEHQEVRERCCEHLLQHSEARRGLETGRFGRFSRPFGLESRRFRRVSKGLEGES